MSGLIIEAQASSLLAESPNARPSFYRPELDALRLFAFFSVFLAHGPRFIFGFRAPWWEHRIAEYYSLVAESGIFGLCLFFFLSSFLITELLLREVEKTGSVHLKSFYTRRILRIWPLYYLGVAIGITVGFLMPREFGMSHHQVFYLVFLVGYLGGSFYSNPMGPLWSISVEELFYLVWPMLAKFGRRTICLVSISLVPFALGIVAITKNWYNPLGHFIFFATGGLLALILHERPSFPSNLQRSGLLFLGIAVWIVARFELAIKPTSFVYAACYLFVDVGCVLIFLAIFRLPGHYLPKQIIYLGQISYGLYVFHLLCFTFVGRSVIRNVPGSQHELLRVPETLAITLAITMVIAALSFRYFESPFLKLKRRFEFIRTRVAHEHPVYSAERDLRY